MNKVFHIIQQRRAIYPEQYSEDVEISVDNIEGLLQSAHLAPTHKITEPWRFKVFHSRSSREELSMFLMEAYKSETAAHVFSQAKMERTGKRAIRSGAVIAICMVNDGRVPEWEDLAATAMAVQNIWLAATSLGIGAYWSSPGYVGSEACRTFLGLSAEERCLGFFYMGHFDGEWPEAKRSDWKNNVVFR